MRGLRVSLVLFGITATGCATVDRGHFEALSTVPIPGTPTVVAASAEGRACGRIFQDPLRRAIDDALKKAPGANALVDVHYRFEDLCVVVSGRAVKTR